MKCNEVERFLLRSLDRHIRKEEEEELKKHLETCPRCCTKKEEYQHILDSLREKDFPEPKPYFWERLQPRLAEAKQYDPWSLWKQWALRAIPASLLVVAMFAAATFLLVPAEQEELSQSGDLLLRNLDPLQETTLIFLEEEKVEDKNMMLIFTAMEEKNSTGRYLP